LSSFKRKQGGAIAAAGILVGAATLGSAIEIGSTLAANHPVVAPPPQYANIATSSALP
jgi:F0F1-type ATP synthase membrane subunit c/vacuolar-type H+-ATPase subunit K